MKDSEHSRNYYRKWRQFIIENLGGKCQWPGCTWSDNRALCIDHVVEDLKRDDPFILKGHSTAPVSRSYAYYIIEHPEQYQLLCANHNQIKEYEKRVA